MKHAREGNGRTMNIEIRSRIRQTIGENRDEILSFLRKLVYCNSYSHNKPGIDAVAEMVTREMPACFSHKVFEQEKLGNHHVFAHPVAGLKPIVLVGHIDTLCPENASLSGLTETEDRLVGPGVNNMKGGDVVLIWSLKVLEACTLLEDVPLLCIFNGDEELGSPTSNPLFRNLAGRVSLELVFECGGSQGTVVTTRKGVSRYRLHITRRPDHLGNLKGEKVSAIEEMAAKILAVERLNRRDEQGAAKVGRARGGIAANAVADTAVMDFDLRYWDPQIKGEIQQTVKEIAASITVPGCTTSLEMLSYRPPMQPILESMELFQTIVDLGSSLGQRILEEQRGGLSDGCWLSHVGIPTIDGLGPLGNGDFTPQEYIITETLFQRIELVANVLYYLKDSSFIVNDMTLTS